MTKYDAIKVLNLEDPITKESIKTAYREASKKYHPDVNPAGIEMMKAVNSAYDVLKDMEMFENLHGVSEEAVDYGEELNNALNAIYTCGGLHIEICGSWVWVTGRTKDYKDILKSAGFKWASKKKSWYFRPASEGARKKRGTYSMEKIRDTYGSTIHPTKDTKRLA